MFCNILDCIIIHFIILHCNRDKSNITLHHITFHHKAFHHIELHCITIQLKQIKITLHYITWQQKQNKKKSNVALHHTLLPLPRSFPEENTLVCALKMRSTVQKSGFLHQQSLHNLHSGRERKALWEVGFQKVFCSDRTCHSVALIHLRIH
jgi:hypothetical protein